MIIPVFGNPASTQGRFLRGCRLSLAVLFLGAFAFSQSAPGAGPMTAPELARRVDQDIQGRLDAAKVAVAAPADDAEFVRRAYLDIHGVVPPADRVVAFLDNKDADKRAKLIDELLASSQYGRHMGLVWYNRMLPATPTARRIVSPAFQPWLADRFNQNRGWDRIVSDIILSEGGRDKEPATSFYLVALNDDPSPQPDPGKLAAAASRLFLGLRLECCQCHDHPFTNLKQTEFWGLAAFFTNVRVDNLVLAPKGAPTIQEGVAVAAIKRGPKGPRPISATATIEIPESKGKTVNARFLGGPDLSVPDKPQFRPALAAWIVGPTNPYFARAAVNRTWAHFFGRGLVDPVDDMRPEHASSHPELLDLLAREFVASGFDLKHLVRSIANTQAYQRTSTPPPGDEIRPQLYAHMAARVMTADQLYDSLTQVLGRPVGEHIANGGQKVKYGDGRERFRAFFHGGSDDDNIPVPAYGHGIPQVLRIMNQSSLTDGSKLLPILTKQNARPEKVVESLYLTTLARFPTPEEARRTADFVAAESDRNQAYADLLWVLLNSGEFLHNH